VFFAFVIPVQSVGDAPTLLRSGVDANVEGTLYPLTAERSIPVRFRSGFALHTGILRSGGGSNSVPASTLKPEHTDPMRTLLVTSDKVDTEEIITSSEYVYYSMTLKSIAVYTINNLIPSLYYVCSILFAPGTVVTLRSHVEDRSASSYR
jgi:hypothetical protein